MPTGTARISGADRVATSVQVSRRIYTGATPAVVIASSASYADSIGGATLAASLASPLLLTTPDSLPAQVAAEVSRVATSGARIIVLGGTGAVSEVVATELAGVGDYRLERIGGADRYATAAAIAAASNPKADAPIYLASGRSFPDGLAVAPLAAAGHGVVLLTDGESMAGPTRAYLDAHDSDRSRTIAVGGAAARAHRGGQVIVGVDRYDTAARIALRFDTAGVAAVGISTGTNWPDALVGAAAMGRIGGPLLLADDASTTAAATQITRLTTAEAGWRAGIVFGGDKAVPPAVADRLRALM